MQDNDHRTRAHISTRRLVRRALVVALLGLTACGGGSAPSEPQQPSAAVPVLTFVYVALTPVVIEVGARATAVASGRDQHARPMTIGAPTWRTEVPSVATVSADGVVQGVGVGQTGVIATVNGKEGRFSVTVVEPAVARVTVTPSTVTLAGGETRQLQATVFDREGRVMGARAVGWSSADPSRVTVSSTGVIQGVSAGSATVTVTSGGVSATVEVTVMGEPGAVTSVSVSPKVSAMVVGDSLQLTATLRDAAGAELTGREVSWQVSVVQGTGGVARVSGSGRVTALSVGRVVVEATSEGQRGAVTIDVAEDVDEGIVVSFAEPVPDEVVGDTLSVVLAVSSRHPQAQVLAKLTEYVYPLVYGPIGGRGAGMGWKGKIDLSDYKFGTYTLYITVTDVTGAVGVAQITFKRDPRTGEGGTKIPPKNK